MGSSTAEGTGASPDSSWVELYRNTITQGNTKFNVINLARGGFTTWHILPDGTDIPGGMGITIDTDRNITEALTYNPSAVIINLPSNDAASGFGIEQQLENFAILYNAGQSAGTEVYIATTQPRNFDNQAQIDIQMDVRDSILDTYGDKAIDFWSAIATAEGWIDELYDSGDGVHLNNAGHFILGYKLITPFLKFSYEQDWVSSKQSRKNFSLHIAIIPWIIGSFIVTILYLPIIAIVSIIYPFTSGMVLIFPWQNAVRIENVEISKDRSIGKLSFISLIILVLLIVVFRFILLPWIKF